MQSGQVKTASGDVRPMGVVGCDVSVAALGLGRKGGKTKKWEDQIAFAAAIRRTQRRATEGFENRARRPEPEPYT